MKTFNRDVVERIRDRISIEDLCEMHGISVNHSGRCLCPFHDDHNPSATAKDGYFRCWTCMEKPTDIFGFVQMMYGEPFYEAVKRLGRIAGISVEDENNSEIPEIEIDAISKASLRKCKILLDKELKLLYKENPIDFWSYIYLMASDVSERDSDTEKLLKKARELKDKDADFFANREIRIR